MTSSFIVHISFFTILQFYDVPKLLELGACLGGSIHCRSMKLRRAAVPPKFQRDNGR